jgi:6-phosphofructokinase
MTSQTNKIKKIAIATGGGDAPGLNAVIRAATCRHHPAWKCTASEMVNGLLLPSSS